MKPKAALVKAGFLPPTALRQRGRLSAEAMVKVRELASQGWEIEGYQVSQSSDSTPAVVTKVKTAASANVVPDVPEPSRSDTWIAKCGDKVIGMRTVCNNCRCSLTYCRCESPKVWLDYNHEAVVTFKVA